MEVVRATEASRNTWVKNDASLNFAVTNLKLPGFPRTYRVVSTCHHRGSVGSGHWLTRIVTNAGWFELDDLIPQNLLSSPPGVRDKSVTIILLIAEDKLS
jgi:ubiquitin C-terminal hydrolase